MPFTELLRYGNWSGPGWTAGVSRKAFDDAGTGRIISQAERNVTGIDRYDNFVAKAHDLNEFAAQAQLRSRLAALGLVDARKTSVGGRPAWRERLVFGSGGEDLRRFVSLDQYMAAFQAQGPGDDEVQALGEAFIFYFCHLIHSNAQFAIDAQTNRVARWRNRSRGSYKMAIQLGFAPHLFLGEAHRLSICARRCSSDYGVTIPTLTTLRRYLDDHFLTPAETIFAQVDGEGHIPVLSKAGYIQTSREMLVDVFDALGMAIEQRGADTVERKLMKVAPQGFDAVEDLFAFLQGLGWNWN